MKSLIDHSKSKWNRSRYVNAEFDALIDEAVKTASDPERFALYGQADRVLMKDFGVVPTTVRIQIAIRRPAVTGIELSAMGYMPFANVEMP